MIHDKLLPSAFRLWRTRKPKKWRSPKNNEDPEEKKRRNNGKCIVHSTSKEDSPFTSLDEVGDPDKQFQKLLEIQDLRLVKPPGSSKRMSEVCACLPGKQGTKMMDIIGTVNQTLLKALLDYWHVSPELRKMSVMKKNEWQGRHWTQLW